MFFDLAFTCIVTGGKALDYGVRRATFPPPKLKGRAPSFLTPNGSGKFALFCSLWPMLDQAKTDFVWSETGLVFKIDGIGYSSTISMDRKLHKERWCSWVALW